MFYSTQEFWAGPALVFTLCFLRVYGMPLAQNFKNLSCLFFILSYRVHLIWYVMLAVGSVSMNGGRISLLLLNGYPVSLQYVVIMFSVI